MSIPIAISVIGGILAIGGFFVELIAIAAMSLFSIRRRLPFKSPFDLLSVGGTCLFAGLGLVVLGAMLQ